MEHQGQTGGTALGVAPGPADSHVGAGAGVAAPVPALRARAASLLQRQGTMIALIAVCVFGVIRYEAFATPENLLNVLRQNSMLGFVALGMTMVVLTGGIDLSVGSVLALGGITAAALSPYGTFAAIAGGLAAGAVLGVVNGVLITRARIQPFIVTLAMMIAVRGVALGTTNENSVRVDRAAEGFLWLGRGRLLGVPVPVLLAALAFLIGWTVLRYTRYGRYVYASGDHQDAARLLGLKVDGVLITTYAVSGVLAALAGVVLAGRLGAGQPVAGAGWELDAIAAVVVGGTLLSGGQGGVGATLVGVLLLGVIFNLFNLEGTITPWWQGVLRGVFLLGVVVIQSRLQRRTPHGH
ncbi:ABC transporter permease subunit [Longimicrobium terrae]|uniref:Ribose transport system permease protein n=1 Tax=Longimicrobium terrae TaxID=1639882 RepID=A0A841GMY3_9BACT|nr:ribose transport system permease protein [Longimicrobium terrae]MBB6070161.1 ribose transport system permease protein [Longimicrobium terrae]